MATQRHELSQAARMAGDGFAMLAKAAYRTADALATPTDPEPPAEEPILTYRPHPLAPAAIPDRAKLAQAFGVEDGSPMFWADPSNSIDEAHPPARESPDFAVIFNEARRTSESGGSSWVNAAIPLKAPAYDGARLTYAIRPGLGNPGLWHWGLSGKLPGLMCWRNGRTPGGGIVGDGNWSARICWSDWNKDGHGVRLGPYVYSQHAAQVPGQIWAKDFDTGTVRWGGPVVEELSTSDPAHTRWFEVEETVTPISGDPGQANVTVKLDGVPLLDHNYQLVTPEAADRHDFAVTHVSFAFMYGGNTKEYGPPFDTVLGVKDFRVVAL